MSELTRQLVEETRVASRKRRRQDADHDREEAAREQGLADDRRLLEEQRRDVAERRAILNLPHRPRPAQPAQPAQPMAPPPPPQQQAPVGKAQPPKNGGKQASAPPAKRTKPNSPGDEPTSPAPSDKRGKNRKKKQKKKSKGTTQPADEPRMSGALPNEEPVPAETTYGMHVMQNFQAPGRQNWADHRSVQTQAITRKEDAGDPDPVGPNPADPYPANTAGMTDEDLRHYVLAHRPPPANAVKPGEGPGSQFGGNPWSYTGCLTFWRKGSCDLDCSKNHDNPCQLFSSVAVPDEELPSDSQASKAAELFRQDKFYNAHTGANPPPKEKQNDPPKQKAPGQKAAAATKPKKKSVPCTFFWYKWSCRHMNVEHGKHCWNDHVTPPDDFKQKVKIYRAVSNNKAPPALRAAFQQWIRVIPEGDDQRREILHRAAFPGPYEPDAKAANTGAQTAPKSEEESGKWKQMAYTAALEEQKKKNESYEERRRKY